MQSYYQQKLLDIYMQGSTGNSTTLATPNTEQNPSAVSSLTNAYAELYQLHKSVKEGL